ncbi:hypothetical protein EDD85DRAFT_367723 [Armillaria nabsnona]|nr:hypothetical protein EDD85DRAFT_367723 [Armillaria nabsnona]
MKTPIHSSLNTVINETDIKQARDTRSSKRRYLCDEDSISNIPLLLQPCSSESPRAIPCIYGSEKAEIIIDRGKTGKVGHGWAGQQPSLARRLPLHHSRQVLDNMGNPLLRSWPTETSVKHESTPPILTEEPSAATPHERSSQHVVNLFWNVAQTKGSNLRTRNRKRGRYSTSYCCMWALSDGDGGGYSCSLLGRDVDEWVGVRNGDGITISTPSYPQGACPPRVRLGQVQRECYSLLDKPPQRNSTLKRLARRRAPARLAPVRTLGAE